MTDKTDMTVLKRLCRTDCKT